jgi:hypothetical protein
MIKSTKSTLTFSNTNKLNTLHLFLTEYKRVTTIRDNILESEVKEFYHYLLCKNIL